MFRYIYIYITNICSYLPEFTIHAFLLFYTIDIHNYISFPRDYISYQFISNMIESINKVRGSGIRQQMGESSSSGSKRPVSVLEDQSDIDKVEHAKLEYKKGKITAASLQKHVPDLAPKASQKNVARDAKKVLSKQSSYPEVYEAEIDQWDPETCQKYRDVAYFILIWEALEYEIASSPDESYTTFDPLSPLNRERSEWGRRVGVDPSNHSGIAIWGDNAPMNETGDSLNLLLWSCLSSASRKRNWICAFSKKTTCACGCMGRCTYDSVLRVIVWMFRVMVRGKRPALRHDGVPFSESARKGDRQRAKMAEGAGTVPLGCMLKKKGDWSWLKAVAGLCGWRGEGPDGNCCFVCGATWGGAHSCFDCSLGASWRTTMGMAHSDYVAKLRQRGYVSPLWDIPGFHYCMIALDLMHIGCLGILQYLLGNTLFELFREMGGLITDPRETLGQLKTYTHLAANALEIEPPVNGLTIGMVKRTGCDPKFRGKAAETRRMLKCVEWLLDNIFKPNSIHTQTRRQCIKQVAFDYKELEHWDPTSSPAKVAAAGRTHVTLYLQLSRDHAHLVERLGYTPWKYYPKHHLFIHLVEHGVRTCGNPREIWCYLDESSIGEAVRNAEANHAKYICRNVIEKHRL